MLTKRKKANAIKMVEDDPKNTGSAGAQVAILTRRIEEVTSHLKTHKKDNHSRRGLIQMVADRRTHLKYLEKHQPTTHKTVVKKLGLRG